jgi:hypothetical protein
MVNFLRIAHFMAHSDMSKFQRACKRLADERLALPTPLGMKAAGDEILVERKKKVEILLERILHLVRETVVPNKSDPLGNTVFDILHRSLTRLLAHSYLKPKQTDKETTKGILLRSLNGLSKFLAVYREAYLQNMDSTENLIKAIESQRPGKKIFFLLLSPILSDLSPARYHSCDHFESVFEPPRFAIQCRDDASGAAVCDCTSDSGRGTQQSAGFRSAA